MNIRKGLIRLWIIFSIPWWAVTGWIAFDANRESEGWYKIRLDQVARQRTLYGKDGNYRPGTEYRVESINKDIELYMDKEGKADDRYEYYVSYMLPIPLIFGFVLLGGFWVFQGFRSKE